MSDETTQAEADELWLFDAMQKVGRRPTDEQIDDFIERVAVMIVDGGVEESRARNLALLKILGGK